MAGGGMTAGLAAAHRNQAARKAARFEDFLVLRRHGLSSAKIARRLDVSVRTVERYKTYERDPVNVEKNVTRVMRLLRDAGMWKDG